MESSRPTILILSSHYLPGKKGGGPIRSLANLVERMGDEYRFLAVTLDHDFCESTPYPGIQRGVWTKVGKAEVLYLSERDLSWAGVRQLLERTPHDILYLNSICDPLLTVKPLFLRRFGYANKSSLVVAPRGELFPAALAVKPWKKIPYMSVLRLLRVCKGCIWHATNPQEKQTVVEQFGAGETCFVANNLAGEPRPLVPRRRRKTAGTLRLAFAGRVHPIKNIDYAIERLKPLVGEIEFNIYGTLEKKSYWETCEALSSKLPSSIRVKYCGSLSSEALAQALGEHDALLFPTQTENFGHAIIEAFAAGLPVVTSDQTPWRQLEASGVGWDIPLNNPDKFSSVLQQLAQLSEEELKPSRQRAFEYARSVALDPKTLEPYREMFGHAAMRVKK